MTIVDSSVWIDFFRGTKSSASLAPLLEGNEVLLHPWVLGELALGSLGRQRESVLADLRLVPVAPVVPDSELLGLIAGRTLHGRGIGWVDVGLLASALVVPATLWSFDRRLAALANEASIAPFG
jgi:predicted nucleic acid-binding protein